MSKFFSDDQLMLLWLCSLRGLVVPPAASVDSVPSRLRAADFDDDEVYADLPPHYSFTFRGRAGGRTELVIECSPALRDALLHVHLKAKDKTLHGFVPISSTPVERSPGSEVFLGRSEVPVRLSLLPCLEIDHRQLLPGAILIWPVEPKRADAVEFLKAFLSAHFKPSPDFVRKWIQRRLVSAELARAPRSRQEWGQLLEADDWNALLARLQARQSDSSPSV